MIAPLLLLTLVSAADLSADQDFANAMAAFEEADFETAISLLELAVALERPDEDRAVLLTWLAVCTANLQQSDVADRHFRDALAIEIEVPVPKDTPPHIASRFEELRREAWQDAPGDEEAADAQPREEAEPVAAASESSPAEPLSLLLVSGVAALSTGVVLLAIGGVFGGLAAGSYATAADRSNYTSVVYAARDAYNLQAPLGAAVVGLGAVVVIAGGVLVAVDLLGE